MCRSRGEWCKIFAEVCNGQEFVTFSVQKPIEISLVAASEKKKSQGQKRRERRRRMKEKIKKEKDEKDLAKSQVETTPEEVSTDTNASDEVFVETVETNTGSRLRIRSRRTVSFVSVGEREAVPKPSKSNKTIEQLDGVIEIDDNHKKVEEHNSEEKEIDDDEDNLKELKRLVIFLKSADLGWKEYKVKGDVFSDVIQNNIEHHMKLNDIHIERFTRISREDSENTFCVILRLKSVIRKEEFENILKTWKGFKICRWE